tara:strand:+ start:284 stop:442 length:159 start_codon:yes stop_codon:yes gene_type:complete
MKNRDVNKFVCLGYGAFFGCAALTGGKVEAFIVANIFLAAFFIINAGAPDNE